MKERGTYGENGEATKVDVVCQILEKRQKMQMKMSHTWKRSFESQEEANVYGCFIRRICSSDYEESEDEYVDNEKEENLVEMEKETGRVLKKRQKMMREMNELVEEQEAVWIHMMRMKNLKMNMLLMTEEKKGVL